MQKQLDEMTLEELASLEFEADKKQPLDKEPLQRVKAALKVRTGVRAGAQGWPPSSSLL